MIIQLILGLFAFVAFSAAYVRWGNSGEFAAGAVALVVIAYNVVSVQFLVGAVHAVFAPTPPQSHPGPSPWTILWNPPLGLLLLIAVDVVVLEAASDAFRQTGIPDGVGHAVMTLLVAVGAPVLAWWDALTRVVLGLL
jgi:hypothetical protein